MLLRIHLTSHKWTQVFWLLSVCANRNIQLSNLQIQININVQVLKFKSISSRVLTVFYPDTEATQWLCLRNTLRFKYSWLDHWVIELSWALTQWVGSLSHWVTESLSWVTEFSHWVESMSWVSKLRWVIESVSWVIELSHWVESLSKWVE